MMIKILILFFFSFIFMIDINSQQVKIDLSYGIHISKPSFHHSSPVTTFDDKYKNKGIQFVFGITGRVSKKWKLRTELGLNTTNSVFIIQYNYDEGFGEKRKLLGSRLNNKKLYLGILPQYNISSKKMIIDVYGGLLLSRDLANNLSSTNKVLNPDSSPVGLKIGSAITIPLGNLSIRMSFEYIRFSKSKLFNRHHPSISYHMLGSTFGIIYNIGSTD